VVDTRESSYIKQIQEYFGDSKNVSIVTQVLDVGDFLFRYESNNLILIERKTLSDLLSSIKSDGRYKEQKLRLLAEKTGCPGIRIFYLIEGQWTPEVKRADKYFTEIDRKIVTGAYIGTIVRDQLPVIQSQNLVDTFKILKKISDLIIENPGQFLQTSEGPSYLIPVKIKKEENKDARWCYLAQLQQISGVSEVVAEKIEELYPNMGKLMDAFKESKNAAQMLCDIEIPERKLTKTGKTRKIGEALSEKIYKSFGF